MTDSLGNDNGGRLLEIFLGLPAGGMRRSCNRALKMSRPVPEYPAVRQVPARSAAADAGHPKIAAADGQLGFKTAFSFEDKLLCLCLAGSVFDLLHRQPASEVDVFPDSVSKQYV